MKNTRTRRSLSQRYRSAIYAIQFLEDLRDFPDAPSVLSEGDSWFGYPFGKDLNDHIAEFGSFNIRHFEKAGDELVDDMMGGRQKKLITKALKEHPFQLLLYSGGGNDIVADNLTNYILPNESGVGPYGRINEPATSARIKQLKDQYIELINLVEKYQNNCPIVAHGYSKIMPSDVGFNILGFNLAGPWVKPTMDVKNVPLEQQGEIINYIMDLFNVALLELDQTYSKFHYIDLRQEKLLKSDWANEIHPTTKGFKKLAKYYEAKIRELVPYAFVKAASKFKD